MNIDAKIIKAYKRTIEAEHNDAEFGTVATRRAVTRAANTLSRKITECYPNIDMAGKIKLRTQLQELA